MFKKEQIKELHKQNERNLDKMPAIWRETKTGWTEVKEEKNHNAKTNKKSRKPYEEAMRKIQLRGKSKANRIRAK